MIKCKKECVHLRKRLQEERYKVLEDGENWLTIVQAIEAVGKAIVLSQTKPTALAKKRVNGLGDLIEPLQEFVKKHHPTASREEEDFEDFKDLLEEVRQVRNAEVHRSVSTSSSENSNHGRNLSGGYLNGSKWRRKKRESVYTRRCGTSLYMAKSGRVQTTDVDTLFLLLAHKGEK